MERDRDAESAGGGQAAGAEAAGRRAETRGEGRRIGPGQSAEQDRLMQLVMDSLPMRLFWKDRDYRYLGCNRPFANDAGLADPSEIIGRHDFELAWKDSAPIYRADDIAVVEQGHSKINYEEPQVRSDGSSLWLRTSKVPLRDESGRIIGLFGCYEDITEKQRAVEALRQSEERYRALFEHASDGIFVAKPNGRCISVNPAGCAMLGFTEEELCERRFHELVSETDQSAELLRLDELRPGATLVTRRQLKHADGSLVPVELSGTRLPSGVFEAVVRDITERVRLEEEQRAVEARLRHVQRMEIVARLAGGIAHDFNNLLSVITCYGDLLERRLKREERSTAEVGEILRTAARASDLTEQLLAFGRRQVLQPEPIGVNGLAAKMLEMLPRLLGETIAVEVDLAPGTLLIQADRTQVEQVIVNLAVNARDAMPDGGTLKVRTARRPGTSPNGDWVALAVEDDGVGMDAETLAHVFEPFFTTKGPDRGTGLGLAMVQGTVEQSGGRVSVDSGVGRGTTVTVEFPAIEGTQAGACSGTRDELDAERGCATLLLVEDDQAVRDVLCEILEGAGYRVLCAASGEEALAISRSFEEQIPVLVSDVVMPGMSGTALAGRLREERAEIRVLLMSGYSDQLVRDSDWLDDRTDFLKKPITPRALLGKIAKLLSQDDGVATFVGNV